MIPTKEVFVFSFLHFQFLQAFACAALGYVLYHVFASGLRSSRRLGSRFGRAFLAASLLLAIIWPMYPICWGLSEGGNVIGVSAEVSGSLVVSEWRRYSCRYTSPYGH